MTRQLIGLTQLAAVVDSSGEAIFALSLEGAILSWNRGAEQTFGVAAVQAIGADVRSVLRDDGSLDIELALRKGGRGEAFLIEGRCRHANDRWIDVTMTLAPVHGDVGIDCLSVVGRDVSAQLEAMRAREQLQIQLAHAQRLNSVGQLAGGVAHEFNNLLAVMRLYGEFALEALPAGHPARDELEHIRNATERAGELTRQLLTFSRREPVRTEILDAGELLQGLEHVLGRLLGEAVELRLEAAGTPMLIEVERSQFEQVVLNLATNARDAMPSGGSLTITASVSPTTGERGSEVVLTVTDSGQGMTQAVREQIFEPFFTTKPRGQGTGLGLAAVYGTVMSGGGRIEVDSEPGGGTRFVISLPRATVDEGEEHDTPPAPDDGARPIAAGTVDH